MDRSTNDPQEQDYPAADDPRWALAGAARFRIRLHARKVKADRQTVHLSVVIVRRKVAP